MQFESGEVTVSGGVRIHYRRSRPEEAREGSRKAQPVVLSHGITDSSECWPGVVGLLGDQFDLVLIDARGHGKSGRPESGYSYEAQVTDLVDVMRHLEVEDCVLMGHSMGAQTSAMAVAAAPELVSKLVLEDPPWRGQMPKAPGGTKYGDLIAYFLEMDLDEIRESCRMLHPGWHEDEVDPWARSKHEIANGVVAALRPINWEQTVDALHCPTLLLTGDVGSGAIVTRAIADAAVQRNPKLKEVRIGGAGHSIRRDRREQFLEALRRFLF